MFVVIGIVVLAIFILVFFLRDGILTELVPAEDTERILSVKMQAFTQHVNDCVDKETKSALDDLAKSGGMLNPVDVLTYDGKTWTVLCGKVDEHNNCVRTILTKSDFAKILKNKVSQTLPNCIITSSFEESGYILTNGEMNLDVDIGIRNLIVSLNYPTKIQKETTKIEKDIFPRIFDIDLVGMIDLINDIIEMEAEDGGFTISEYPSIFYSEYMIEENKDDINSYFVVGSTENDLDFKFAVRNEDR